MKKILLFLLLTFLCILPLSSVVYAQEIDSEPSSAVVSDASDVTAPAEEAIPDIIFAWIEENLTAILVVASAILTGVVGLLHKKGLAPILPLITALIKKLFGTKDEPGILAQTESQNEENRKKIEVAVETMQSIRNEISKAAESCDQSRAVVTYTAMAVQGFEEILRTLIHGAAYPDYQKDKLERLLDETRAYTETAVTTSSGIRMTAAVEGENDEKLD